jgi:hypothetical protein
MLQFREWQPQTFQMPLRSPFCDFPLDAAELGIVCMTSVGVSSADLDVLSSAAENCEWIRPDQQVARVLVELFKEIPQVKSICARFGYDEILIWTLLDSYDRDAREKVYGKELDVCRLLGIHNFDFRVTSADLVPPEELVAAGSREIYRRR